MAILVADVGGTNSRLALANVSGVNHETVRRFANVEFRSFYDVIEAYLKVERADKIEACCIAIAGHVSGKSAKLTNLNWQFSADEMKRHLSCGRVQFLNDLTALGYSIDKLGQDCLTRINQIDVPVVKNGQSLVVGIGTGFNICPIKRNSKNHMICMEAEYGHSKLSECILDEVGITTQESRAQFDTVERLFSGQGLLRLYSLLANETLSSVPKLIELHQSKEHPYSREVLEKFAHALGSLTSELVLRYLPMDGIYFAGSIARVLFESGTKSTFCESFNNANNFNKEFKNVPISVINDDFAPLKGCFAATQKY